ncbi:hypothetical protein K438DRAFT_1782084 [Mycena galopus ATCC 62051]|nr:hypothetical protein K438DRAFT_1782084 [Mycena galopus ATCC 62051]
MAGKYIRLRRGWARMRLRTVGSGVAVAVARGSAEGRRREAKTQITRAVWGEGGSGGGGGFESQGRARRPAFVLRGAEGPQVVSRTYMQLELELEQYTENAAP